MIDLILVLLLIAAIVVAAYYRARAEAARTAAATSLTEVTQSLASEFDELGSTIHAKIDAKFLALAQWLRSELEKLAPAVPAPAPPPAEPAPLAPPVEPQPAAVDPVAAKIDELDKSVAALQEHRAKLVAARDQLQALL
jgi:hypothetical protein